MHKDQLTAMFDKQAPNYEKKWEKMHPIREGLYCLLESIVTHLPNDTRVLSIGVGTGAELVYLAKKFPQWHFTAVDPSGAMLDVCRQQAEREGFLSRCTFHKGYLNTLPNTGKYHAATCFLVSQFILEPSERSMFFRAIAERLHAGGVLASADLASDMNPVAFKTLLQLWLTLTSGADVSTEQVNQAQSNYARDVAILNPATVAAIIQAGGFESTSQFYQAGLLHAWVSKKST